MKKPLSLLLALCLLVIVGSASAADLGYYTFDTNMTSGTTIIDSLGLKNGTRVGTNPLVVGKIAQAVPAANSDYMTLGDYGDGNDLTILGWMNFTNRAAWYEFVGKDGAGGRYLILYTDSNTQLRAYAVQVDGTQKQCNSNVSWPANNQSVFFGAVADSVTSQLRLYINGTRVATCTIAGGMKADTTSSWHIGYGYNSGVGSQGYVDEVYLASNAMTDAQVTAFYDNQTLGRQYPFPTTGNASLTISLNDTRTGSSLSGFTYQLSNGSVSVSGYCASTTCDLTINITNATLQFTNISGAQYFDVNISNITFNTGGVLAAYMGLTYKNSISMNMTNLITGAAVNTFCITLSSGQNGCTTNGSLTLYKTIGNFTIKWHNSGLLNVSMNLTGYNSSAANYTNASAAYRITANVYERYTNNSLDALDHNITNGIYTEYCGTASCQIYANNGSNNVRATIAGYYGFNTTCDPSGGSCELGGAYNNEYTFGIKFNGAPISTFSLNATNASLLSIQTNTTNGSITLPLLRGYSYTVAADPVNYTLMTATLPANASTHGYNFTVYRAQTLDLTFRDEIARQAINGSVTLELINPLIADNYTTSNGSIYLDLLVPHNYTLRYRGTNYPERDYYLIIAAQSYNNPTLYMIPFNDSGTVIASVVDTGGEPVEGATVKLLRFYTYCNCYEVVEMAETSASGEAYLNAQYYEGHYKWSIDYAGINYFLSTSPENLVPKDGSSIVTRSFTINIGEDYYEPYTALSNIGAVCSFNSNTGGLSFTWDDPQGLVTSGCLDAEYVRGVHYVSVGPSCANGNTGSIVLTLNNTNETKYKYAATLTIDGTAYTIEDCAGWIEPRSANPFGTQYGAFIAAAIIITLVLIFSYSALGVLAVSAGGIILVSALGLMTFSTAFIGGLVVLIIGLGVYLMRS